MELYFEVLNFLFPEETDETVTRFLKEFERNLTKEIIDGLEMCIGCGLCGAACQWHIGTNLPEFHPKARTDEMARKIYYRFFTLAGKIKGHAGLIDTPDPECLKRMSEKAYQCCTMCGRCSFVCPQGVNIKDLTRMFRAALCSVEIIPPEIKALMDNAREKKHTRGLDFESAIGPIIKCAEESDVKVPVDIEGVDFLIACSAIANTKIPPQEIVNVMKVFNILDINWTISSQIIDTGTEVQTVAIDKTLGRMYLEHIEAEVKRLKIRKAVIVPECGCDVETFFLKAPYFLGRKFNVPAVVFADKLVLEAIKEREASLKKLDITATFHNPCKIVRCTGLGDESMELLKMCVKEVIMMEPSGTKDLCCGGSSAMNIFYPLKKGEENLRSEVSEIKAEQLRKASEKGAKVVATPCVTCYLTIGDIVNYFGIEMKSRLLLDIVYEAMKGVIEERGETDKMKTSINMRGE